MTYKTEPLGKQRDVIESSWSKPIHALLCRPGTGKTKMLLDTAAMQYEAKMIKGLLVISPNGVHEQWIEEGVPRHLSVPWLGGVYITGMGKLACATLNAALCSRDPGLKILSISYDGLQTKAGLSFANRLLSEYRCLVVADESHQVSNTKSAGYKATRKVMRKGYTRRIATGTLIRQNPFSAYGQYELMDTGLLGFESLASFKSTFAEMLPPDDGLVMRIARDFARKTGQKIKPLIQAKDVDGVSIYKNLPFLRKQLEKYSSFMTLADVSGTEPIIMPSTRYVHLTTQQRQLYTELVEYGVTEAPGGQLTADGALALSIRLSQVVGGFCPSDDDLYAKPVDGANPKMDELLAVVDELGTEKIIIWARFKPELRTIAATLTKVYGKGSVAQYHGDIPLSARSGEKKAFIENPRCRFLVAHQKAAGTGLDGLQGVCSYACFYSNDYPYLEREQAVARIARTGGSDVVNTIDLMAHDSIDAVIVRCMQSAQDVHAQVLQGAIVK